MPTGTKQQIHTSQLHGGSYGSSIPVKPAQYQINNSVPSGEMIPPWRWLEKEKNKHDICSCSWTIDVNVVG